MPTEKDAGETSRLWEDERLERNIARQLTKADHKDIPHCRTSCSAMKANRKEKK